MQLVPLHHGVSLGEGVRRWCDHVVGLYTLNAVDPWLESAWFLTLVNL
jgi:hypothetical protein